MSHILWIRIIYVVHTFCVPQEWTLNLGDTDTHYERLQWHGTHHILNQRTANVKENVFYIAAQKRQKIIFLHKNQYFVAWKQMCLHFLKKIRRHTGCSKSRNRRICGGINDYDNVESEILTWWWGEHFESRLKVALVDSRDSQTSGFPLKEDQDIFEFEYIHTSSGNPVSVPCP